MKNSWWGQELHPYNQYEDKERTPNLESVFAEFMAYHASSTTHRNSMQNQDIHVGTSYSMENYQWEQELQPYNQYEEERSSNMDSLLMQFKETVEYTQRAFKSLEIQVGKLAEHVAKFFATREENFVEVEAHEESLVEKHDSKEKDERRMCNNGISTHNTSLAMIWKVFLKYMSFMEFLAKRRKCKEDVFYVTFMPP
ncbi:hypothetical protein glysoja_036706 [Glycine soja]|uniref:Uncharacterized protein n=1 Tax=Glycine soja TaxID=3848 RepID=A0A0B2P2W8_GLYSO|nr:hypothetical protein glysoja_036706 [Glycine soja]